MNETPEFQRRTSEEIFAEYQNALTAIDQYIESLDIETRKVLRSVEPDQETLETYLGYPIEDLTEHVRYLIEGDTFNAVSVVNLREALAKKMENLRLIPGR